MILVPFAVDVPMYRWPIANWCLMGVTTVVSFVGFAALGGLSDIEQWMLSGSGDWWSDAGLLGATLTHADPLHLIGNMLFLFVFGNAVNAKLGHALFIACYFFLGVLSSMAFAFATGDGTPALGASGAISGITGMFIVLFPKNSVSIFFFMWVWMRPYTNVFEVSAWIVIGCYFGKDLVFQLLLSAGYADSGVALMAHLGGTVAGVVLALLLLLTDRIRPSRHEQTLLNVVGLGK